MSQKPVSLSTTQLRCLNLNQMAWSLIWLTVKRSGVEIRLLVEKQDLVQANGWLSQLILRTRRSSSKSVKFRLPLFFDTIVLRLEDSPDRLETLLLRRRNDGASTPSFDRFHFRQAFLLSIVGWRDHLRHSKSSTWLPTYYLGIFETTDCARTAGQNISWASADDKYLQTSVSYYQIGAHKTLEAFVTAD